MSWVLAGLSVNRQVEPTAGYQLDVLGAVRTESEVSGDVTPYMTLVGFGVNSATTSVYTGDRDPNGFVAALPGSFYLRQNGVSSNVYVNVSVGPGAGTSWSPAGSLGAVPTWSAVLGAGNTSGGTDAVMSNPDELRWEDGAAVTRRSDDLNAGEPRTRYFTAAAALAATLSVATATSVMSYTADFTLDSSNPHLNIGNNLGAAHVHLYKIGLAGSELDFYSDAVSRFRETQDSAEDVHFIQNNAGGILVGDTTYANATANWTMPASLTLNSGSPVLIEGNDGGSPTERTRKSDAGSATKEVYSAGFRRWTWPTVDAAENLFGARYDGAGALVNIFLAAYAASSQTELNDATISLSNTNPTLICGTGGGAFVQRINKADIQESFLDWHNVFVRRWILPYFRSNEDIEGHRYNAAGVFVNVVWEHLAASQTSNYGDSLIAFVSPDVVAQIGNNTGTQPQIQLRAAAASSNYFSHYQGSVRVWDSGQTHNDSNWYVDRYVAGVFSSTPIQIDNAANITRLQDDTVWLRQPSVTLQFGDSLGSPNEQKYKADAGSYLDSYYNVLTVRWQDNFATDESRIRHRYDAAGAFIGNALTHFAANTLATAQTDIGDATVVFTFPSVTHYMGDATGEPTRYMRKADVNAAYDGWQSGGVTRALGWVLNTDESFHDRRFDAVGAVVNDPLHHNASATVAASVTTLGDRLVALSGSGGSVTLQVSNHYAGESIIQQLKSDADVAVLDSYSATVQRGRFGLDASENYLWANYSTPGGVELARFQLDSNVAEARYTGSTFRWPSSSVNTIYGDGAGSPTWQRAKNDAGSITDTWVSNAITRAQFLMNPAEEMDWRLITAASVADTNVRMFAGGIVAMDLPGTQLWIGDWSGATGSPLSILFKADAGDEWHHFYSAGLPRARIGLDAAEDAYWRKLTAAGATETEIAQFVAGFVRMQTHYGITDGIAAPAALAGYAKFFVDSVDGDYKMIFADGVVALLAPDNAPTQAWPILWRDTTDLTVDGTAGETNIFTRGIPAGMLLANGALRLKIGGDLVSQSAAATIQLRIYFGATLLYDVTTNPVTTGGENSAAFWFVFELPNQNATNAQRGNGCWGISPPLNAATGVGGGIGLGVPNLLDPLPFTTVAGALDTTVAQTLRVTITWAGGNATDIFTRRHNFLQISPLA